MSKEAFVYEWSNTANGKKYVGYHKGSPDDDYVCSSTNDDLWSDYWKDKESFKRTIVDYGSTKEMLRLEHKLLSKVDAKNSDDYYNKSNGGIFNKGTLVDFELVEKLFKRIDNQEFTISQKNTLEVYELPKKQVRQMEINNSKVEGISERIKLNSTSENADRLSPVILVSDVDGEELLLIDGNHTIKALMKNNVPFVDVMVVPFEELNYNYTNLTQLGLRMNRVEDLSTNNSNDDLKRTIKEFHDGGVDIEDKHFKSSFGEQMGISNGSVGKLVEQVVKNITIKSTNFKVYDQHELDIKKERQREFNEEAAVILCQSRRVQENGVGQILKAMLREGKQRGIILTYHKDPSEEAAFKGVEVAHNMFNTFGLDIEVRLLPSYEM